MSTTTESVPEPATQALGPDWVEGHDAFDNLQAEWKELVRTGAYAAPFFQPEWLRATAESFLSHAPVSMLVTRRGKQLRSVLPLCRTPSLTGRVPLRTLRGISSVHSCRLDLIHAENSAEEVAMCTWRALRDDPWWTAIVMNDVPASGSFRTIMSLAQRDGYPTATWRTRLMPFLDIPAVGDPFALSPKRYRSFRNRLKGKLERLAHETPVHFKRHDSLEPSALEQFFALEAAGWKGTNRTAIAMNERVLRFYNGITERAAAHGYARMYTLERNGKPIAMHLGFYLNGIYYSPKVAYDEAFRDFSLGHLLMQHVIRDLAEQKAKRFDFLGPNALWKSVWTTSLQQHDHCYIFRPTLLGKTAHGALVHIAKRARAIRHKMYGDPQDLS